MCGIRNTSAAGCVGRISEFNVLVTSVNRYPVQIRFYILCQHPPQKHKILLFTESLGPIKGVKN